MQLFCVHAIGHVVDGWDSSCALAANIFEYNYEVEHPSSSSDTAGEIILTEPDLKTYLKEYEKLRWLPTTSLTVKAAILGERLFCHVPFRLEMEMLMFIIHDYILLLNSGYLEVGPWLLGNFR
jgi:hypothetical protein